jgi:hypothetical protein
MIIDMNARISLGKKDLKESYTFAAKIVEQGFTIASVSESGFGFNGDERNFVNYFKSLTRPVLPDEFPVDCTIYIPSKPDVAK